MTDAIGEAVKAPQTSSIAPLGVSEIDRVNTHISNCWIEPVGVKGAKTLKVNIMIKAEKDGSVKEVKITDQQRYRSDVVYRAAANSARRAVLDCQPLPLPPEKYQFWKEMDMFFSPTVKSLM